MNSVRKPRRQGSGLNARPKMTREQMQLAIIKKKECDAKALKIVEQMLEPTVDIAWLQDNLKNINRCHMEDVIEERAITKLCGYVLCQKPITNIVKQRWSISLKEKKVYDVTKRKSFCSSSCFGASNYLLEQMLTSPLWMRDKEEVPTFHIISNEDSKSNVQHGDELDIRIVEPCTKDKDEDEKEKKIRISSEEDSTPNNTIQQDDAKSLMMTKKEVSGNIENFVLQTLKNINVNDSLKNVETPTYEAINKLVKESKVDNNQKNVQNEGEKEEEKEVIEQRVHFVDLQNTNSSKNNITENCDKKLGSNLCNSEDLKSCAVKKNIENETCSEAEVLESQKTMENKKQEKVKPKSKKQTKDNVTCDLNLAARVEQSFHQWIKEETINFLFGDNSDQQKVIEKIERQDRYTVLYEKLNRLQFEDEQEDAEILEKPVLKPAPHYAVLQEEGQKLQLKVNAFYEGKLSFQEPEKSVIDKTSENPDSKTFLPLTETHASNTLRRKIFLERLDQVVPDLIRTLAGNNEVYIRASYNYTSLRSVAIKALVHTFSLSSRSIIFKTAEWTLVGLIIIKMLSLLDPWLTNLLNTKQANMYISMILTSYKLNPDYLNLFVASFNKNITLRSGINV